MGKLRRYWNKVVPFRRMKAETNDPNQYAGQTVWAKKTLDAPEEQIVIADVRGCLALREQENYLLRYFQVNGTHFCSMYSFYMQMHDGRRPTEEEEGEFNLACEIKAIKEVKTDGE